MQTDQGFELIDPVNDKDVDFDIEKWLNGNFRLANDKFKAIDGSVIKKTSAAITYYVRPDGNDANDGSANTPDKALRTIAKASEIAKHLVYDVTVNIADGTYNEDINIQGFTGKGMITFKGNETTPGNVKINRIYFIGNCIGGITVSGIKPIVNNGWGNYGFTFNTGVVWFKKCLFDGVDKTVTPIGNFGGSDVIVTDCVFNNCLYLMAQQSLEGYRFAGGSISIGNCTGTNNANRLNVGGGLGHILDGTLPSTTNKDNIYRGGQVFETSKGSFRWGGLTGYTSPGDLGLTNATATVAQICDSMADASFMEASFTTNALGLPNDGLWLVKIYRRQYNLVELEASGTPGTLYASTTYKGTYNKDVGFNGWKRLLHEDTTITTITTGLPSGWSGLIKLTQQSDKWTEIHFFLTKSTDIGVSETIMQTLSATFRHTKYVAGDFKLMDAGGAFISSHTATMYLNNAGQLVLWNPINVVNGRHVMGTLGYYAK